MTKEEKEEEKISECVPSKYIQSNHNIDTNNRIACSYCITCNNTSSTNTVQLPEK
jgi:uncharacterized protein affecting Mg2+/Co2+ transport